MKLHIATLPSSAPVFWLETSYDERDAAKAAGFLWHGGNCKPACGACAASLAKVWWTRRIEAARSVAKHASDAKVRAVLGGAAPPAYEKPVEIPDANLKLAILSALIYERVLQPMNLRGMQSTFKPSRGELAAESDDGVVRADDWMYTLNHRLANKLVDTPVTPSQLAALKEVHWPERPRFDAKGRPWTLQDGIFPQWDGEEGEFNIRDLTGVEHCTNLVALEIASYMVEGKAEKQLATLAKRFKKTKKKKTATKKLAKTTKKTTAKKKPAKPAKKAKKAKSR